MVTQQISCIAREDPHRQLIIVTHHSPTFSTTTDPKHNANPWNSAFCTELLESRVKSWHGVRNIRRWIFGHTHWNTEFKKHGMIVCSNQRGYIIPGHERGSPKIWAPKFLDYFSPRLQQEFIVTKIAQV